jgi:hypothetical protein
MYTENTFALDGQAVPMLTKRLSLPLSNDGLAVDMALACHIFEYDRMHFAAGYVPHVAAQEEVTRLYLES